MKKATLLAAMFLFAGLLFVGCSDPGAESNNSGGKKMSITDAIIATGKKLEARKILQPQEDSLMVLKDKMNSSVKVLNAKMDEINAVIGKMNATTDNVDGYSALIDKYNALKEEHWALDAAYEQLRQQHNELADRYNQCFAELTKPTP